MSLSPRNEWIVVGVLILYIAFIPCPGFMTDFFSSAIGKMVALGIVVYVMKYLSVPVGLLVFIALDRKGAIREYADDPSMAEPLPDCHCEAGYDMDPKTMICTKGSDTKAPTCCQPTEEWDAAASQCKAKVVVTPPGAMPQSPEPDESKPTGSGAGGPPGGTTPSAAAQMSAMADLKADPVVENFSPYEKSSTCGFSPL